MEVYTGNGYAGLPPVKCPHCDFEYNHIMAVHYSANADTTEKHGIDWNDRSHSALQLDMQCENHHDWKMIIVDCKGYVVVVRRK